MTFPKIIATGLIAGLVVCSAASAEEESLSAEPSTWNPLATFKACTEIDNDIARLQCFDAAAAELGGETREVDSDSDADSASEPSDASAAAESKASAASTEAEEATAEDEEPDSPVGAATRPTDPMQIIEADEPMVAECEFLGSVQGKSGWGGLAANAARKGSIRSAKKKAFKLGATHIVIREFDNGIGMKPSSIAGRAYRCD